MSRVRVLLSEGSSLTAREVLTCLGPLGHHIEVLDPDPICIARFSRWTRRLHRCPAAGADPLGYLEAVDEIVRERGIDVLLPTHEQAWLLSVGRTLLGPQVRVALATAVSFERVQGKIAFAQLLDELGLPQPGWRLIHEESDLAGLAFPYWLKTPFSTAGRGVRAVSDERSRAAGVESLLPVAGGPLMAQQPAVGSYGQVQALFERGRLVAVHTSVQRGEGIGGSAAARVGVDHPAAREHVATLGAALDWHGGITLDYLHDDGAPTYIECNPRTVEPGNAAASGVNLPALQVDLSLESELPRETLVGRGGVRTHGTLALLLGAAAAGGGRRGVLREAADAVGGRGVFDDSLEQLTPLRRDPLSAVPLAIVLARVLASPDRADRIASEAVERYSVDAVAIDSVRTVCALDHG